MQYADTSVLVTALTVEPESRFALDWLVGHQESTYLSDWTVTEFAGALSRKCRAGDIDDQTRNNAHRIFDRLSRESLTVLAVTRAHFREAAAVCRSDSGLRSGDALHVAIARDQGLMVVSRDRAMVNGARRLGLQAILLGAAA